jgi:hypothetical protein
VKRAASTACWLWESITTLIDMSGSNGAMSMKFSDQLLHAARAAKASTESKRTSETH